MKVSIITVTYNAAAHLRTCIESVRAQDYPHIEYIVIDGLSKDATPAIVAEYGDLVSHFVSEKDQGIYDAMNKGLAAASGDIIGILNADDAFASHDVITKVVKAFEESAVDAVYGDVAIFKPGPPKKLYRYYSARNFKLSHFRQGDMPPHPGFFAKRTCYERWGNFDTRFRIAADFDLLLRFLWVNRMQATYLPLTMVNMLSGGASSSGILSNLKINREMLESCKKNGLPTSLPRIYSKYFRKVRQLLHKP